MPIKFFVEVTYVFPVPYPNQEDYWAHLMADRMSGKFYPIKIYLKDKKTLWDVNGVVKSKEEWDKERGYVI